MDPWQKIAIRNDRTPLEELIYEFGGIEEASELDMYQQNIAMYQENMKNMREELDTLRKKFFKIYDSDQTNIPFAEPLDGHEDTRASVYMEAE